MIVELSLREAQRLYHLLNGSIHDLQYCNDANYPFRALDIELLNRLQIASDPYWNI